MGNNLNRSTFFHHLLGFFKHNLCFLCLLVASYTGTYTSKTAETVTTSTSNNHDQQIPCSFLGLLLCINSLAILSLESKIHTTKIRTSCSGSEFAIFACCRAFAIIVEFELVNKILWVNFPVILTFLFRNLKGFKSKVPHSKFKVWSLRVCINLVFECFIVDSKTTLNFDLSLSLCKPVGSIFDILFTIFYFVYVVANRTVLL